MSGNLSAKLLIRHLASGRSFDFQLKGDQVRIGRAADRNTLVLGDVKVSREHALLRLQENAYVIEDLGSSNGTFVNGERLEPRKPRPLKDGDVLSIGNYTIAYKEERAAPTIRYDQQMGDTVLLRNPEEISAAVPEVKAAGPRDLLKEVEALRKKAETLARIYELNRLLSSVLSLEQIFKKVSEMFFRLTPADRFFVLLRDGQSGQLRPFAAEFRDPEKKRAAEPASISKTVLDRVLSERVSLLAFDAQTDQRLAQAQSLIMQRVRSVMCAPLLGKDGVLGVIYVDNQDQVKPFSEDDLDLLNALAAETSIAVDNAITHEQLLKEALARAAYCRFMPQHVVNEILTNPKALSLGGSNRTVTMLFSDIRGFTSMSEAMPPETVVQILNYYFSEMTPIVFEHDGLLDKYIGDGLMALFGVPYESDEAAANAVAAAVNMQRQMLKINQELARRGFPEIAIGIGINTGTVTIGYIGSEQRTDYTAIGDAVNLAARLEKHAKPWQILISRSTMEAIADRFPLALSGEITVKGRKEPVQIYEVLWREESQLPETFAI
jgi:adenylate cyclase